MSLAKYSLLVLLFSSLLEAQETPRATSVASGAMRELTGLNDDLQGLAARIAPSVVKIEVMGLTAVHDPSAPTASFITKQNSVGSGIVIDASGLILTNAHVVAHATSVQVTIYDHPNDSTSRPEDVHRLKAKILGLDALTDIALLKVEAKGLAALKLANSDLVRVGQLAMAFGSPLGLENTLTLGIISATQRQLNPSSPVIYLQTDASINPGNSGGPLVNIRGEVIGMNTLIASESGGSEGVGFSIPAKTLAFVYNQLRTIGHVRRGALGISVAPVTPELAAGLSLADTPGVILEDVTPGSSADTAGLKPGDLILSIDGKKIQQTQQVAVILFSKQVGDSVRFVLKRQDATVSTIDVPVTRRPRDPENILDPARLSDNIVPRLGFIAVPLSPEVAKLVPPTRRPKGLVIVALTAEGKAASVDLQVGDVLYTLNHKEIDSVQGLRDILAHLPDGAAIALQIERDGKLQYVAFTNPD
jgi:serine protease Do